VRRALKKVGFKQNLWAARAAQHFFGLSWTRVPGIVGYVVLLGALIASWQLYVTLTYPSGLPGPSEVVGALVQGWMGYGSLAAATWMSLAVLALGSFIGLVLAVLLVILATWTRIGDDLLTLLARTLDTVPAIAILPILVLWMGTTSTSLILVAAYSVVWPVATGLRSGLKGVDPTIVMVGQNLGLRGWGMVRDVFLPAALPHTISGARTGWAYCWRTVVAAELVLGVAGERGRLFTDGAGDLLRMPELFAGLINVALIGILVEAACGLLERHTVFRWGMKSKA
jgi:NitT/TauT family transport system permease protein